MTKTFRKAFLALPIATAVLIPTLVSTSVQANPLKKHPLIAGAAAGMMAHHMAKKGAAGRMAHGQKPNMAERHPMLSGVGAAMGAHHMLKK